MAYSLRCPVCRVKMPWNPAAGFPEFCPNVSCESRIAHDRDDADVVMPFYKSAATKANDSIFDRMVAGSEKRAEIAAQMAGVPVSEMSDLKITDLRPTTHAGDVAAVPVNNLVTQFMAANPQAAGFRGGDGLGYSGAVSQGFQPNRGAQMRSVVQSEHGAKFAPGAVSDRPALETQQPGYRRRG
jgi:hypothetical protein